MKLKTFVFLSLLLANSTNVAFANEAATNFDASDEASIDAQVANSVLGGELDELVEGTGLEIKNYHVEQQFSLKSEGGLNEPGSCTVTTTVSVPGVAEITLSATASTCEEATIMIINGILELIRRYGSVIQP